MYHSKNLLLQIFYYHHKNNHTKGTSINLLKELVLKNCLTNFVEMSTEVLDLGRKPNKQNLRTLHSPVALCMAGLCVGQGRGPPWNTTTRDDPTASTVSPELGFMATSGLKR